MAFSVRVYFSYVRACRPSNLFLMATSVVFYVDGTPHGCEAWRGQKRKTWPIDTGRIYVRQDTNTKRRRPRVARPTRPRRRSWIAGQPSRHDTRVYDKTYNTICRAENENLGRELFRRSNPANFSWKNVGAPPHLVTVGPTSFGWLPPLLIVTASARNRRAGIRVY